MLSITLAILALYVLELAKMVIQQRVVYVAFIVSGILAILALYFAFAEYFIERNKKTKG